MKYVVYLDNPDHYFSRMLWCFDSEDKAEKIVGGYYDLSNKFSKANFGLQTHMLDNYSKNNPENKGYNEVYQEYWDNFCGIGIDQWIIDSCEKNLYSLFQEVDCDLQYLIYSQYNMHVSSVLEK